MQHGQQAIPGTGNRRTCAAQDDGKTSQRGQRRVRPTQNLTGPNERAQHEHGQTEYDAGDPQQTAAADLNGLAQDPSTTQIAAAARVGSVVVCY
jgi:hypothetical protein